MRRLYQKSPRVISTFYRIGNRRVKNRSFTDSLESYNNGATRETMLLRWNKRLPTYEIVLHFLKVLSVQEIKSLRTRIFRYLKEHGIEAIASIELTRDASRKPNNTVHFHILTSDQRSKSTLRRMLGRACSNQRLVRGKDYWFSVRTIPKPDRYFEYFTKRNRKDVILFKRGLRIQKFYEIGHWFYKPKKQIWQDVIAYMRDKHSIDPDKSTVDVDKTPDGVMT